MNIIIFIFIRNWNKVLGSLENGESYKVTQGDDQLKVLNGHSDKLSSYTAYSAENCGVRRNSYQRSDWCLPRFGNISCQRYC